MLQSRGLHGHRSDRLDDVYDHAIVKRALKVNKGTRRKKHLHDVRGTFATRLILAGLADADVAEVMGWPLERVSGVRRTYVDQSRVVVAMGERISQGGGNRTANREEAERKS